MKILWLQLNPSRQKVLIKIPACRGKMFLEFPDRTHISPQGDRRLTDDRRTVFEAIGQYLSKI